ncbi:hypothetical protein [Cohnella herbarum]|uniref:HEAT repeat domain-containing protein n=1 Tax=Cohnella herbarum TaxID=2728023 RepID=A0A7Z2VEN6_9BACL|nr:hypothetical protein [Cohnella herbarum]QJD81738.1 hypothetical protein HH215_00110 [Cohnella herbarum]
MSVQNKLATSLNRKDEEPNELLAQAIVDEEDGEAIAELIGCLRHKDKNIQSDAIKVLYEVGERKPDLISEYCETFVGLLAHANNRLAWGAMTALDGIAAVDPHAVHASLPIVVEAMNKGSVIVKDHGVGILIKLYRMEEYAEEALSLLMEQLRDCPTNQLPMYAENALKAIRDTDKTALADMLLSRLIEIEKDSKRKRVEIVIKKLGGGSR